MSLTARRGFTLIELITVLVLVAVVGGALYQMLINNQRVYRSQTERIRVTENARAAISVLPGDIRELNAADPAGSDILTLETSGLSYKAMRGLYLVCQAPEPASGRVTVDNTAFFGLRRLDPSQDSILLFAENAPASAADDVWLHADVSVAVPGTRCPGATPSLEVQLLGVTPAQLAGVSAGAPLRHFEVARILLYESDGAQWLGSRTYQKISRTWSGTQPVVGPLSSAGLKLAYFDRDGLATAEPAQVARVGITVQSRSGRPVRAGSGETFLLQTLVTHVALRNNPRF